LSDPSRSSTSASASKATKTSAHQVSTPASLFISNLAWWTNEDDLMAAFEDTGNKIKNIQFLEHKANGKSKGIAIVEFIDEIAASQAREIANGKEIHGLDCGITFARTPLIKPHERRKLSTVRVLTK
jgi:RNA recognition motif-containing protein